MKITPGEWKISGRCADYCGYEKCRYVWISPGSFTQGTGFKEGDARVLVEAKNMLKALRGVQAMLRLNTNNPVALGAAAIMEMDEILDSLSDIELDESTL